MNGWKVCAIVFMILFVVETIIFIYALKVGTGIIENENECSLNICKGYDAYFYDDWIKMCYCYDGDKIVYEEFVK